MKCPYASQDSPSCWVAVKELRLSQHNEETLFCNIPRILYSISVPSQQPSFVEDFAENKTPCFLIETGLRMSCKE